MNENEDDRQRIPYGRLCTIPRSKGHSWYLEARTSTPGSISALAPRQRCIGGSLDNLLLPVNGADSQVSTADADSHKFHG